jgi:DNA replication protein DnaC
MEALQANLKTFRLSGMAKTLQVRYQEAKANELDYLAFLENLVSDELGRRKENLLNRRIKQAHFPALKTLDDFDFSFNPVINKREINDLASCKFIHQAKNVLLVGPPGVGKTHLSLAIGLYAIQNGYTVYYRSAFDLVEDLAEAFRMEQRKKLIQQLTAHSLLILDEFGMKKMPPHAADDLLELIHRRHSYTATLIATNRPIKDWGTILGDNAATSAILDRFFENATIFNIKGRSYRMKNKEE